MVHGLGTSVGFGALSKASRTLAGGMGLLLPHFGLSGAGLLVSVTIMLK